MIDRAAAARIAPLAWGALAVAGVALAVAPQHAASIARLLAATIATAAVLLVVVTAIAADLDPTADRRPPSPLDRPPAPPLRPIEAPGLSRARRALLDDLRRRGGDVADPADVAAAANRILEERSRP